jgi:putative flippase GtrA
MSAAGVSETGASIRAGRRPLRFLITGLGATLLYAVLAALFSAGEPALMNPVVGSVLAYGLAAGFSYAGHKYFTFVSDGAHRLEAPRFVVVTLLGLAVSFASPAVLSGKLGLPVQIAIGLTCVVIPFVNYVVLRRWVFAGQRNGLQ